MTGTIKLGVLIPTGEAQWASSGARALTGFAARAEVGAGFPGRRYDGWLPYPPDPADYVSGLALISRAAADAGRPARVPGSSGSLAH